MRAMFPKDAARRAFLQVARRLDRAGRALAILPAQDRDRGVRRRAVPMEKKDLKVGFIPITCATPIIMAKPMGFYAKHGLNVEVIKTAGWAVIRDKTINKEYDAAHMLSPMPLAISHGRRLERDPLHDAGGREHQRPGDHARRSSTRTSATRRTGRASSSRCRSTIRCTIICCAITSPSTASIPTRTSRSAPCRRRKWWPTCAPTISTASSAPIRSTSARCTTASASSTCCRRKSGTAIPCCAFAASKEFVTTRRTPTRRCSSRSSTPPPSPPRRRIASRSPKRSRRRTISTSR